MNDAVNDKFCCIDRKLYISKQWIDDKERCSKAGIPEEYQFRSKTEIRHIIADFVYATTSDFLF